MLRAVVATGTFALMLTACGPDASTRRACEALVGRQPNSMALAAVAGDDVLREHGRAYVDLGPLPGLEGSRYIQLAALRCRDLGLWRGGGAAS